MSNFEFGGAHFDFCFIFHILSIGASHPIPFTYIVNILHIHPYIHIHNTFTHTLYNIYTHILHHLGIVHIAHK